jgi:phenylacetate-CoA ligase
MSFNPLGVGLNALNLLQSSLLNPRQIADFQESRFRQLIAYAYQHSGFYQKKYHGIDLGSASISSLPVVRKIDLMKHFDSWVCDPEVGLDSLKEFIANPSNIGKLYLEKYVTWESSGSSSFPAIFLQDSNAMDVYDALEGVRQARSSFFLHAFDPFLLSQKLALVGATDGHFASNVSFERAKATRPQSARSFKSISIMGSLAEVIDELNQYSPNIIATYPTTAVILADAIQDGSLKVSPQEIWTGGETLTPKMREHINRCFHVNVRHSYGASEVVLIV